VIDEVDLFVVIDRVADVDVGELGRDVVDTGRRVDGRLDVIATEAGDEDF